MTVAEETLVVQIRSWLEDNLFIAPDKHQAYRQFIGQCDRLKVSEDRFYEEILPLAYAGANFDEYEDPDPPNAKHTHVQMFGEKIHSLKKLGTVLFSNVNKAAIYFEDATLLKGHVDTLMSADEALQYAILYKTESNEEKRFLKIVYHLNPKLPYRLDDKLFASLDELFKFAFGSREALNQLYNAYAQGLLQIWLNEAYPQEALKASQAKSFQSFLRFIYAVDKNYPFYVKDKRVENPQELAAEAMVSLPFRMDVYELLQNEHLFIWFDCIGCSDWQLRYQLAAAKIKERKLKGDDLVHALIQKLCTIIVTGQPHPQLQVSEQNITYLALEAGEVLKVPVGIELINAGYVNCHISLDILEQGIRTDTTHITLFDLTGAKHSGFHLIIDPLKLTKNKLYSFTINITTDYEQLKIPVQIKTVFPKKEYQRYLLKYAAIIAAFMGIIRLIAQLLNGSSHYLKPVLIINNLSRSLPATYVGYLLLFLLMLAAIISCFPVIKKYEKL